MSRLWRQFLLLGFMLAPQLALGGTAHLALDVRLDPASRTLHVTAETKTSGATRFELNRRLVIRSASIDGVRATVERLGGDARVNDWRISGGKPGTLRIDYEGTLPPLDATIDYRSVMRMTRAMVSPAGSYLPAASSWYPSGDGHFSYTVRLSLPRDQRGLVPGRLIDEGVSAGSYHARFEFDHPAEGIELMAGPYVVSEKLLRRPGASAVRLRTYFYREIEPLAAGYLTDSRRYIERYSRMIGPYPFASFSVVASPLPTGFGMPTLTYLGKSVLRLPFIRATSLGHEVLHNWWGNGVYPDYSSGNWSEGLTTFMADYAYKEEASPEAAREMRLGWLRDYAAVPATEQPSLAQFRSRAHGSAAAVGYGKSAMVFFMLRDLIGKKAFARGIRRFWSTNRFRVASWDDLRAAFEHASGRDLSWFFSQWVERAGAPRLRIGSAKVTVTAGSARLELDMAQSTPPYKLRVPVEIVTGSSTQKRWIEMSRVHQTAMLHLARAPDGVRLDPGLRLWRVLDPAQLPPILRQWILARAPRVALVSQGVEIERATRVLTQSFFENPASIVSIEDVLGRGEPVLLIGLTADIDTALARLGLPPRPKALAGHGSAQIWTVRRTTDGPPVAVVSVRDAPSLLALQRPLPHYGAQSYLVFEGSRAIDRGVWPAPGRLIRVSR